MTLARVVVTGLGLISPLGSDLTSFWRALCDGKSAARSWPDLEAAGFRVSVACRVPGFDGPAESRGRRLAIAAARAALASADLEPAADEPVAVYVGTTMGESAAFEAAAEAQALAVAARAPLTLAAATAVAFPRAVRAALGLSGPARAYATACAAGNYAIGAAAERVARGDVRAALAGGVEPFSRIALTGFSRARAMAADRCRPFDGERNGMQLGEAAAFLVLEREADALRRGARPLAVVDRLGLTCDAYHPTAPRPDGAQMARAIRQALGDECAGSQDEGWICAHGSGTRASDAAEALALHQVFDQPPPVTGIKGALGHSLGATTAVGAVAAVLALQHRRLPPTANCRQPDPTLALDVVLEARPAPALRWAVNCGFAFGGLNSALVLRRP